MFFSMLWMSNGRLLDVDSEQETNTLSSKSVLHVGDLRKRKEKHSQRGRAKTNATDLEEHGEKKRSYFEVRI